jgi:hypothetical protein
MAIAFQPVAGASVAAPDIAVTPSTGLSDGASVSVSVTGFAPNTTVFIGQCATLAGEPACPAGEVPQATTNASGAASLTLTVRKTYEGFRLDGSSAGTVDCGSASCFVGAGDASGAGVQAALSFN